MLGRVMVAMLLAAVPVAAMAQTSGPPKTAGGGQVTGQQNNQASPSQNQSQMQTDTSQQPPGVKVLPPSADAQAQPNPLPQLSK